MKVIPNRPDVYREYHTICDERLLIRETSTKNNCTYLEVRSVKNLEILVETKLNGFYDFIGFFPDGSFLLQSGMITLTRMALSTLTPLNVEIYANYMRKIQIIDNETIFILASEQMHLYKYPSDRKSSMKLLQTIPFSEKKLWDIYPLGNNRFMYRWNVNDDPYLEIRELIRDEETDFWNLHTLTSMKLELQKKVFASNGRIVISKETGFEIWDSNSLKIMKQLEWNDLGVREIDFMYFEVKLFPNGVHALIVSRHSENPLFLLNIKTHCLKKIEIDDAKSIEENHILSNGSLWAHFRNAEQKAVVLELPEVKHHQNLKKIQSLLLFCLYMFKDTSINQMLDVQIFILDNMINNLSSDFSIEKSLILEDFQPGNRP